MDHNEPPYHQADAPRYLDFAEVEAGTENARGDSWFEEQPSDVYDFAPDAPIPAEFAGLEERPVAHVPGSLDSYASPLHHSSSGSSAAVDAVIHEVAEGLTAAVIGLQTPDNEDGLRYATPATSNPDPSIARILPAPAPAIAAGSLFGNSAARDSSASERSRPSVPENTTAVHITDQPAAQQPDQVPAVEAAAVVEEVPVAEEPASVEPVADEPVEVEPVAVVAEAVASAPAATEAGAAQPSKKPLRERMQERLDKMAEKKRAEVAKAGIAMGGHRTREPTPERSALRRSGVPDRDSISRLSQPKHRVQKAPNAHTLIDNIHRGVALPGRNSGLAPPAGPRLRTLSSSRPASPVNAATAVARKTHSKNATALAPFKFATASRVKERSDSRDRAGASGTTSGGIRDHGNQSVASGTNNENNLRSTARAEARRSDNVAAARSLAHRSRSGSGQRPKRTGTAPNSTHKDASTRGIARRNIPPAARPQPPSFATGAATRPPKAESNSTNTRKTPATSASATAPKTGVVTRRRSGTPLANLDQNTHNPDLPSTSHA